MVLTFLINQELSCIMSVESIQDYHQSKFGIFILSVLIYIYFFISEWHQIGDGIWIMLSETMSIKLFWISWVVSSKKNCSTIWVFHNCLLSFSESLAHFLKTQNHIHKMQNSSKSKHCIQNCLISSWILSFFFALKWHKRHHMNRSLYQTTKWCAQHKTH